MAISVNEVTKVITIPQADLTSLGGSDYELDTNALRLELKNWEASVAGSWRSITHLHNLPVTVGGVTLARTFEIINGYTIEFQDVGSPYRVNLVGSNNNILDVKVLNQVSVASANSAGLTFSQELLDALALMEADHFFDESTGLLHYYYRGTTTDIIPAKTVTGTAQTQDASILE